MHPLPEEARTAVLARPELANSRATAALVKRLLERDG
jgi:hypothetical protein